jgi:hypothetical protein
MMGETTMTGWKLRGAAFAAALVVSGAGAAQAATLTVTDTGTLGTGTEVPLSVAAFDTSLGTLTAVAWSLVIDWSAEVTLSNLTASTACTFDCLTSAVGFDIVGASGNAGLAGLATYTALSPYENLFKDGLSFSPILAPGEAESTTVPQRSYTLEGSSVAPNGLGAGAPADWIGSGSIGLTLFPITTVFDNGDLTATFTQSFSSTLSVTYTYDPVTGGGGGPTDPVDPVPVVPLPAGLSLMLGGLAALAVVRRRRGVAV